MTVISCSFDLSIPKMIVEAFLLFLIGTSASAKPNESELPSSVYFPFYSNSYVKPQIINLMTQLPKPVQTLFAAIEKDNCKQSLPIVSPIVVGEFVKNPTEYSQYLNDRAAHIITIPVTAIKERPLIIPEPPKLPEINIDFENFKNKKLVEHKETDKPMLPVVIPAAPVLPPIPEYPSIMREVQYIPELTITHLGHDHLVKEERKIETEPLTIPTAPVLPFISMPLIEEREPLIIPVAPKLPELTVEDLNELNKKVPEKESPKVVVPAAPELTVLDLPKLPLVIEAIHTNPKIPCDEPSSTKDKVVEHLVEYEEPIKQLTPLVIPTAPILSPLPQYMHELPLAYVNSPVYIKNEEKIEVQQPLTIPAAPELPSIELPKLTVHLEDYPFVVPDTTMALIEENKPIILPEPPKLPELTVVDLEKLHDKVTEQKEIIKETPIVVPAPPMLPPIDLTEYPLKVKETPVIMPPVTVVIPEAPQLAEITIEDCEKLKEKIPEEMTENSKTLVPVLMPTAPVLPQLELSMPVVQITPELPFSPIFPFQIETEEKLDIKNPLVIPSAPVLPAIEVPKLQELTKNPAVVISDEPKVNLHEHVIVDVEGSKIPTNSFFFPAALINTNIKAHPVLLDNIPLLSKDTVSIPNFYHDKHCVDNIVLKRILPKLDEHLKVTLV